MSFTPQMRELFIAYGLTAGGMLIGLLLITGGIALTFVDGAPSE